jgi:hypothetical protein
MILVVFRKRSDTVVSKELVLVQHPLHYALQPVFVDKRQSWSSREG